MTPSVEEIEREIEESRARLDRKIDDIQSRLSVSGIVNEFIGSTRGTQFGSVLDDALEVVRRNPIPVMLVAVGVGWLMYRTAQQARTTNALDADLEDESIPILNTGQARIYDPDISPRHPGHDVLESRREMSARA